MADPTGMVGQKERERERERELFISLFCFVGIIGLSADATQRILKRVTGVNSFLSITSASPLDDCVFVAQARVI